MDEFGTGCGDVSPRQKSCGGIDAPEYSISGGRVNSRWVLGPECGREHSETLKSVARKSWESAPRSALGLYRDRERWEFCTTLADGLTKYRLLLGET